MQIATRIVDGVLILTPLNRRIDAHMAAAFRAALIDRIDAGARRIRVDLQQVEFMDSAGLGALVSALKRIGRDGELTICAPRPAVRSMFELTRLDRLMPIVDGELDPVGAVAH